MDNIKIIVASDSIGELRNSLQEQAFHNSTLNNVSMNSFDIHISNHLKNVDEVIQVAKDTNAIIVYTLIKPEIKKYMISKVNEHALKSVDIMGPLMELLSNSIEETPYYEPGMVTD